MPSPAPVKRPMPGRLAVTNSALVSTRQFNDSHTKIDAGRSYYFDAYNVNKEYTHIQRNLCYNSGVSSNTEKKDQPLSLRVPSSVITKLNEISEAEDRPLGYVARELLIRGLSLYDVDRKLKEKKAKPQQ